ncbi:helix-turn-helix domain-containing protein [Acinetobacter sp. V102_4]|uniref:helix-turn-helix domain-containing protein n=1 Tax=Acinetobacter sp. V102_4 TaxID=3072984 RepID=UPI00287EDA9B|nr:helix-turn-helix domain-containing protein [Acinetobacter sp. V102_4]MDS7929602.1 helix-turn-helix domain-containing protein [Acinetobacter sp. V102_4]
MTTVNKSASKVLKVLKALRGHSLKGVTISDLAKKLEESPSQVYRYLQTLINEGLASQMDDGSYALGREMVAIAHTHSEEISRAQAHITEHIQRVTARVNQIKSEA